MQTKLLLFIVLCFSSISIAQTTYVPDDNFEQFLINNGYDDVLDDYVLTANINTITQLDIGGSNNVTDLTGIEDFTALEGLTCSFNNIAIIDLTQNVNLTGLLCSNNQINGTLDLSQNTALTSIICNNNVIDQILLPQTTTLTNLWFYDNELTTIDVTQNPNLDYFFGDNNLLDGILDLSQNTALTRIRCEYNSIDQLLLPQTDTIFELWCRNNEITALNNLHYYTSLNRLMCSGNLITAIDLTLNTDIEVLFANSNMISSLDLSNNIALNHLLVSFNNLNYLSIKNGNNSNFVVEPVFVFNPSLTCIEVDNATFSTNNWTNYTDSQSYFSEDCSNLSVNEFDETTVSIFPNPVIDELFLSFKTLQNTTYQLINIKSQIQLEGSLNQLNENIDLSKIQPGVYFLKMQNSYGTTIKKIIKQ